jgi:hypothetical protein
MVSDCGGNSPQLKKRMTRANHKTIFLLAYLGLFASGCITNSGRATPSVFITSSSVVSNVGVVEQTPSPMANRDGASKLPSQQPTLEKLPSLIPSPIVTSSPATTPTQSMKECSLANADLTPDFLAKGTLIFKDRGIIYTMSNDDLEMRQFLGDLPCCFYDLNGTSPNKKWLALTHEIYNSAGRFVSRDLVLTSGNERKIIPWKESWSPTIYGWLNNDYLKIFLNPEDEQDVVGMILFDPFTEREREFPVNFLFNIDTINPTAPSFIIYAPELSRVVYLNYDEENFKHTIYLWDMENRLTLWDFSLPRPTPKMRDPVWSSDSKWFIIVPPVEDGYKVFLVTREGKAKQIVEDALPIFIKPVWSPDSKKVAFSLQETDQGGFIIYDVNTQQLTEYCASESLDFTFEPVWSPDSKQIIVQLGTWDTRPEYNTVENIIIDITTGSIAKLDNNLIPIAWLGKEP